MGRVGRPPTSGGFRPGTTGNPRGRPKGSLHADIAALAREHGPLAIATLGKCLADPKHRVSAAVALLDRGWGRPQQTVVGDSERPIAIDFSWAPATEAAVPQAQTPLTKQLGKNVTELAWEVAKDDE